MATTDLSVLLVEDNPNDATLIERHLREADTEFLPDVVEIHHETDLDGGLETLDATEIDLVLLDLGLPGSTGVETFERAREATEDVPVIVLTGLQDEQVAVDLLQRGAQDYLNKSSLDRTRLVKSLRYALERQERERELKRQNERLERFASVVSHDLRNPLNVAKNRLDLARREVDSDHLEDVAGAHDRIEALIEDLLTLARSGKPIEETEPVELGPLAEACWRNVDTDGAELLVETDRRVRADRSRLKQLLENLVRNAVKHGDDGTAPTITVGDLPDGFFVADDGPGIPESDREQVFEHGYTSAADGTGFGLSIVADIADAHGWDVRVTESDAGGARFEITGVEAAD